MTNPSDDQSACSVNVDTGDKRRGQPRPVPASGHSLALVLLTIVSFFNYLDRAVFSVLAVPMKEELGLSDTQIGILGGLGFAIFYAALAIPIARLADRSHRVSILSTCLVVWSTATALCGAVGTFYQLLLARIFVASGEAGCVPASYSILSDYYPVKDRTFAMSIFHFGGNIGFLFGIMGATILAGAMGWRMAFVVVGAPGVLFSLALFKWVKEPIRGAVDNIRPVVGSHPPTIRKLLSRRAYIFGVFGYSLSIWAFISAVNWLPHLLVRIHGMTLEEMGIQYGLSLGMGMIIGAPLGGFVATRFITRDRRWEMWFPAMVSFLAFPCFAAATLLDQKDVTLIFIFFGSLFVAAASGPVVAAVQSLAEPKLRAVASAILLLVNAIVGQGLGPTLVGVTSDLLSASLGDESIRYAILSSQFFLLPAALLLFLGGRRLPDEAVV